MAFSIAFSDLNYFYSSTVDDPLKIAEPLGRVFLRDLSREVPVGTTIATANHNNFSKKRHREVGGVQ